jgi:RNA polymerase sigma-70 factor (ECF subfamily)
MTDEQGRADEWITRIASGDRDAFASLYRRYQPDVYRFAAHVSGSPAVAEDVVHDVFIAVIEDAARYQPGRSGVLPWLFGIARNHIRRWRSRRPLLPMPGDETHDGRRLAVETDPLADLARRRNETAVRRALLALPLRYREAIVLCDLHELSYDAAAKALGCAVGTVRSRLHRGRALLARRLCQQNADPLCRLSAARPIS